MRDRYFCILFLLVFQLCGCRGGGVPLGTDIAGRSVSKAWRCPQSKGAVLHMPRAYPDLASDVTWKWQDGSTAASVGNNFTVARGEENNQLGSSLPPMSMPVEILWAIMGDKEKALWLINREREDRGITPLEAVEQNVTSVAQAYAEYLLDNDLFTHFGGGTTPWERMTSNNAIAACNDGYGGENLAVFWTSGNGVTAPVARSVYAWMYQDSGSSWGHRQLILDDAYYDNNGDGQEGFVGIGHAAGGPHQGWNHADIVVMNVFDPCGAWGTIVTPTPLPGAPTPAPGAPTPIPVGQDDYISLAAGPAVAQPGEVIVIAFSLDLARHGAEGVPLDIYCAVIRNPLVTGAASSVEDTLGGEGVYFFLAEMEELYYYRGEIREPTFSEVVFPAGQTGSIIITIPDVPAVAGDYAFAACFVYAQSGAFVRTDGLPVQNSGLFRIE